MAKVKIVRYHFFKPTLNVNGEDRLIDLRPIFERIRLDYLHARENENQDYRKVYSYNNEPARLTDITVDAETGFYHLVLERLSYEVPTRTTLYGDSEAINLLPNEYIGKEVSILFDSTEYVLMIQRNRESLGTRAITAFISTLLGNAVEAVATSFNLAIITLPNVRNKALSQSKYRKLQFKVTGARANGLIERLTHRNDDLGIDSVEVIFSSKSNKDAEIDEGYVREVLEDYIEGTDVQKLKIRARESDESLIEGIDLLDYKLEADGCFEFNGEGNRYLNPISVYSDMNMQYINVYRSQIRRVVIEGENN